MALLFPEALAPIRTVSGAKGSVASRKLLKFLMVTLWIILYGVYTLTEAPGNEAENRLHVQKAIMLWLMAGVEI